MAVRGPTNRDRSTFDKFFREFPDYDVRYTKHARERMAEREISAAQIDRVLQSGSLTEVDRDIRSGQEKYRVEGYDVDEQRIVVVVTLGPGRRVTVVTAF